MTTLADVARHVRSKNAGPYWITIDITCDDEASYHRCARAASLQPDAVAAVYGVDPELVKRYELPALGVLNFSYSRLRPQGGAVERDMHGGQQYVRLLESVV